MTTCRFFRESFWDTVKLKVSFEKSVYSDMFFAASFRHKVAFGITLPESSDSSSRVVVENVQDPAGMIKPLGDQNASSRYILGISVQTQLFCIRYSKRNMHDYVEQYIPVLSQLH